MSFYFEKIPLPENELFILRSFKVPYMSYPMHYHLEVEITYIKKSFGQRFVGDHMENFSDGDLVLIGPNLPHQWRNDVYFQEFKGTAELYVLHFQSAALEPLKHLNDFSHIKQLFEDSKYGIKFPLSIQQEFEDTLLKLQESNQSERFINFFNVINLLALTPDRTMLSSSETHSLGNDKFTDRINHVFSYILENYHSDINLSDAAGIINLSNSAFSHFIKKRTGMTFSELVNDHRVKLSGKLLTETDLSITEICFKSGFQNISYFNRQFKAIKKVTPMEYRKKFRKEYLDSYDDHQDLRKFG